MSHVKSYRIACPKCGEEQEVELYESVNVADKPELKQVLMRDRLNAVECSSCAFPFRVDKSLLYHDPQKQVMIYWIPVGAGNCETGEQEFRQSMAAMISMLPEGVEAPAVHLVFTRAELVERIFLLEAGLNERIIEYIKYIIYTRNMEKLPPADKALLFNAEDSTPEALCFVIQDTKSGRLEGLLQYNREAYEAFCEMFDEDDKTASLLEMLPGPYVSARAVLLREAGATQAEENH